jgi:hypothetical protein
MGWNGREIASDIMECQVYPHFALSKNVKSGLQDEKEIALN